MCRNRKPILRIRLSDSENAYIEDFPFSDDLPNLILNHSDAFIEKLSRWIMTLRLNCDSEWEVTAAAFCETCDGIIPELRFSYGMDVPNALKATEEYMEFVEALSITIFNDLVDVINKANLSDILALSLVRVYRAIRNPKTLDQDRGALN